MIGPALKRLRGGRSQREQARALGISPQRLSDFESDRRDPRISTVVWLAKLYGVRVQDLVAHLDEGDERP